MGLRNALMLLVGLLSLSPGAQAPAPNGATYAEVPNWLTLPEGRTHIGSMHGDIAVSAAGEVYISVEGSVTQRYAILGPSAGLQVYADDGRFLRNVKGAPPDLHGFVINRESGGEFLYGARLAAGQTVADQTRESLDTQVIVKMKLEGTPVMAIPASRIPDRVKSKAADGTAFMRLTGIAVAPNGDIYASDGYASDYIHRFDRDGGYIASFGGKQAPYGFRTLHKLAVDTRFQPARLIACDRENGRIVHLGLDGALLGVVAEKLERPAAIAVRGELAAIGELRAAQVTLLDKSGNAVGAIGRNTSSSSRNSTCSAGCTGSGGRSAVGSDLESAHFSRSGTAGERYRAQRPARTLLSRCQIVKNVRIQDLTPPAHGKRAGMPVMRMS